MTEQGTKKIVDLMTFDTFQLNAAIEQTNKEKSTVDIMMFDTSQGTLGPD